MKEMDIIKKRHIRSFMHSHKKKLYRRTQRISEIYAFKADEDFDQILILRIVLCPETLLTRFYRNNGARELITDIYRNHVTIGNQF